jgi:heat shock protein HtpX
MPEAGRERTKTFDELLSERWRASLLIFALLALFYVASIGLLGLAVLALIGLANPAWLGAETLKTFGWTVLAVGGFIAAVHFLDARYNGADAMKQMLRAAPPDPADRYHKRFANLVAEMAIANGLPRVHAYLLPSHAVNSMALIERDGTPAVLVSEGMLAECSRDELQAAVAHELAHILSGDLFFVTLLCGLASVFEKAADATHPGQGSLQSRGRGEASGGHVILHAAAATGALGMRLLAGAVSRQREYLADAMAAEMTRNPAALATVVYKAHVAYSMLGDFHMSYSPMFIVSCKGEGSESEGWIAGFFSTHPPIRKRLEAVARMAYMDPDDIARLAWEGKAARERARAEMTALEESPAPPADVLDALRAAIPVAAEGPMFEVRRPDGSWDGPFNAREAASRPYFTSLIRVREFGAMEDAPANQTPAVMAAFMAINGRAGGDGACPRCHAPLTDFPYEGVPLRACPACRGRIAPGRRAVERILARRDVSFSKPLLKKAEEASRAFMLNPAKPGGAFESAPMKCPSCGGRMAQRPYNYQYFLPIDECGGCGSIWFDADELEILQVWVEGAKPQGD